MPHPIRALIAARALILCVGFVSGCTVQQVEPPTTATEGGSDPSTSAGPTSGASTGETPTTTDPTATTSGTTTDDPSAGSSGDPTATTGGVDCDGPNGCYNCKPTTPVQVLNACTDASCEPFANTKERLPLLNQDGTLPPLP